MKRIRTATDVTANTTQTITFLDRVLTIKILWNEVSGSFFMNIEDGVGGSLQGVRMVESSLLLENLKGFIDFDGDIVVIKEDDSVDPEIVYSNFGSGWVPYLVTPEEANTWSVDYGL